VKERLKSIRGLENQLVRCRETGLIERITSKNPIKAKVRDNPKDRIDNKGPNLAPVLLCKAIIAEI
jgi:hypothetical protein